MFDRQKVIKTHMDREAMILIEDLSAGYGGNIVLKSLYLSVQYDEVIGITGSNGAGKTTLLKIILGLITPIRGTIRVLGRLVKNETDRAWVRRQIGYVPQLSVSGKLPISVHDATLMGRWGTGFGYFKKPNRSDHDNVAVALAEVGLATKEYHDVGSLSGGERQKLAIARALIREASILLLDEPTTYLDRSTQKDLVNLLETIRDQRKMAIIMISHDADYLQQSVMRTYQIYDGCLKELSQ